MKRKLLGIVVMLTLGLGYCAPQEDCTGFRQNPALCRGTFPPKTPVLVNGRLRIIVGK